MFAAIVLAAAAAPACTPPQLRLTAASETGDFNGMSHSGTYLIIRNLSRQACRVAALPTVTFYDRAGNKLPASRRAPLGMHPGPAVVPIRLAPGVSVRSGLRWVSGPVYDRSRCVDATRVAMTIGGRALRAPVRAHLCGQAGEPIGFEQSVLATPDG